MAKQYFIHVFDASTKYCRIQHKKTLILEILKKSALALSFGQNLSWTLAIIVLKEICIFLLVRFASRVGNVFVFLLLIITLIPYISHSLQMIEKLLNLGLIFFKYFSRAGVKEGFLNYLEKCIAFYFWLLFWVLLSLCLLRACE